MTSQEEWKPVVGYEDFYEVSSQGRVRSLARISTRKYRNTVRQRPIKSRILKLVNSSHGYLHVFLGGKSKYVHTLVLTAFIGPRPEGLYGLHGDGNKQNCAASNLRWGTQKENIADAVKHGVMARGEDAAWSKLSDMKVREIRSSVETHAQLALRFGVAESAIRAVRTSLTWRHVL